ncbi:MAG: hypothetical protein KTR21_12275 [Rhodobacteraceae bacterium]|nr:hypothetical protein [Paracoccaceae bacterium]
MGRATYEKRARRRIGPEDERAIYVAADAEVAAKIAHMLEREQNKKV